jgi:serine/threonine-protein phosphatase 2A regulatory subunit B'
MLVPIINEMADNHWHKVLQESLTALKTILKEIDPLMFAKSLQQSKDIATKIGGNNALTIDQVNKSQRTKMDIKWNKLFSVTKQKNPTMTD